MRIELDRGRWNERNHRVLGAWLDRQGEIGAQESPRAAVFDWDDTCIFRCSGTATFRHQLDRLRIALRPEEVAGMFPERVGSVTRLSAGPELSRVREVALDAYEKLQPDVERGEPERARRERSEAHGTFRTIAGWLYGALEDTPGIGAPFAYPWMARWLGGMRPAEVEVLAIEACTRASTEAIGVDRWECVALEPDHSVVFEFGTGLAPVPEMRALMEAVERVGVRAHVVTASQESVVRGVARHLGYGVDPQRIHGIRLELGSDGRFEPRTVDPEAHPLNHGPGKSAMIRARVEGAPVLVCGDTDGDYDMLTDFAATEIRLVIDRDRGGRIAALYDEARGEPRLDLAGCTLLQARDEACGGFHPEGRRP